MKRPFQLSPRLRLTADLVPTGSRLVDVGTDHGRLPVWLLLQGRIPAAVATDLREKPLSKARELAGKWEQLTRLSLRLCDGLSQVDPSEAETVTITGMGGETIAAILHAAPWTREGDRVFLLQPMTGADGLRRYLSGNGFLIRREHLIEEEGTVYLILEAVPGVCAPYSEGEIWVGRQTAGETCPLRSRYLAQELYKLRRAAQGLTLSRQQEDQARRAYFEEAARQVEAIQKEWEAWQS